jgi:hypothetical protein
VFHVSAETNAALEVRSATTYGYVLPLQPTPPQIAAFSCDASQGKRSHIRLNTEDQGKYLQFGTGPQIRAGPASPADALGQFVKVINFQAKYMGKRPMMWAGATTPNIVGSGAIKGNVAPEELRKDPTVSYSEKFPGDSKSIPEEGVTLEIFLKRKNSKKKRQKNATPFISPGIRTAKSLKVTMKTLAEIGRTCVRAETPSQGSTP